MNMGEIPGEQGDGNLVVAYGLILRAGGLQ